MARKTELILHSEASHLMLIFCKPLGKVSLNLTLSICLHFCIHALCGHKCQQTRPATPSLFSKMMQQRWVRQACDKPFTTYFMEQY